MWWSQKSKAIRHKLLVAQVKATLKEFGEGPSNVGHIGSKVKPRSHVREPGWPLLMKPFLDEDPIMECKRGQQAILLLYIYEVGGLASSGFVPFV